jgi:glyceraldehyde-3-phosphate dehydrogenase/erythrose-4-phosphate dehydrogenase
MSTKIAINGLGRIGRAILKLVIDEPTMELVAVNDLVDVENLSYLLRFDTGYGRYSKPVVVDGGNLVIAGRKLRTLSNRDPSDLPWSSWESNSCSSAPGHSRGVGISRSTSAQARDLSSCPRRRKAKTWQRLSMV